MSGCIAVSARRAPPRPAASDQSRAPARGVAGRPCAANGPVALLEPNCLRAVRLPMPDDDKPSGRRLVLKPREITPTETAARPGDGTAISVALIHRQNRIAEERRSLGTRLGGPQPPPGAGEAAREPHALAPKEITPTETAARPGDGTAISVALIHRQNRIAEERRSLGTRLGGPQPPPGAGEAAREPHALAPKEITPTETAARPGDGTAISVALIHRQNRIAEERRSLGTRLGGPQPPPGAGEAAREPHALAPKEITPTEAAARPGDGTAISVALIHRQNRIAEEMRGPEAVALPRRRTSRRTRDFIFLVVLAGIVVAAFMLQLPRTPGTLLIGFFLVAYAAGLLAWIMFGVMDDY